MKNKELIANILYYALIFLFLFIFFSVINPLILFDTDDWIHISFHRHAVPIWNFWNPTRVFPEVFMPLCGSIAAYFVYPLSGNYLQSLTWVFATAVSLFITAYMFLFGRVLNKKYRQPTFKVLLYSTLFFILHFLIFRSASSDNDYLFFSHNVTCYFYYLIPDILNCCLILYFMLDDVLDNGYQKLKTGVYKKHPIRYGFLLLAMYMALLSNLFPGVILTAYIGSQLLGEFCKLLRKNTDFKNFIRRNSFRLIFILLWLVVQIFELNGQRADSLQAEWLSELIKTLKNCVRTVRSFNKFFILLVGSIAVIAGIIVILNYRKNRRLLKESRMLPQVVQIIIVGIIIGIYLILVCSRSGAKYIKRPDVIFGVAFCFLFVVMLCCVYIFNRISSLSVLLPLVICITFFEIGSSDMYSPNHTFKNNLRSNIESGKVIAMSEDIIQQFKDAEERGEQKIVLYVPEFDMNGNWPIATYSLQTSRDWYGCTLYEHGVIKRKIEVTEIVPTRSKNEELHIPIE